MNSAVSGPLSNYRFVAELGAGGMAEVHLVCSDDYGKLLVRKRVRSDLSSEERPELVQMFQDEARLALRLNHPNIVQAFEAGSYDGRPYIVMEFLEGQTLLRTQQRARVLGEGFSQDLSMFVLCQVLDALDYAHQLKDYEGRALHIVHRDVSPQNVFITYWGHTKLVDFGVAKTLSSTKTCAGMVKGNVAYMAPEQLQRAMAIDRRADVFGVGVLLWETIAAQPMLAGRSVYDSLTRLAKGDLPRIRSVVPNVDPELERIVQRAIAFEPARRYADAQDFRGELAAYLDARGAVDVHDVRLALARLFARERADLERLISTAMRGAKSQPSRLAGDSTRQLPRDGVTDMEAEAPTELDTSYEELDAALVESVSDERAAEGATTPARPKRRLRWAVALGLSLAVVPVLLLGWVRTSRVSEMSGPTQTASAGAVRVTALPAPQSESGSRDVGALPQASLEASEPLPPLAAEAVAPRPRLRRPSDRPVQAARSSAERYVELPAWRPRAAPALDRSEPWPNLGRSLDVQRRRTP